MASGTNRRNSTYDRDDGRHLQRYRPFEGYECRGNVYLRTTRQQLRDGERNETIQVVVDAR